MDTQNQTKRDKTTLIITGTLGLAMLLASLGTSIANIALPTLAGYFDAPFAHVQGVVVGYLASLTVFVVIAGRLGDRLGMKSMLVAGLSLFLAATLLCGLAPNLAVLVLARMIQGIGAAFMMTLSMALLRQAADGPFIGRAMGLLGTMSAIGTALGPSLGGLLLPVTGWPGIFWVQVPLGALALALAYAFLPKDQKRGERHAPSRLRSAFTRSLAGSLLANLLVAAVMMTTLIVGPFYLSIGLDLGPAAVGLVMTIGPVISILSGVPSGHLVDAWGSRQVLVVGLGLLGVGATLLAFLPQMMGVAGYVAAVIVLTPGYQLFQAANSTQALADVPKDHRGTTAGLLSLSRNLGLVGGASIMGAVFAIGVGTADLTHAAPPDIATGMRLTFLLAAALILVALATMWKQATHDP